MMDLRRVQVLRVLAECGTVTAAARAMHLTPSAVSQQIRQLGAELGVTLLSKDGRNVRLTPAALALLRHADALHEQWELARADLAARDGFSGGTLRFCGVSSAIAAFLAPAAQALREVDADIRVHIAEWESEDCYELLLADQADIAVVLPTAATPPVDDQRFDQQVLHDDPQDLLVPAGHRLAACDRVALADAAEEEWIVKPYDNDTHSLLIAACAAAGYTPRVTHHAKEWFAVSEMVSRGFGVCLLPRMVPVPDEHAVVRVPITGNPRPSRKLTRCVRRGSSDHPLVAAGLRALRSVTG